MQHCPSFLLNTPSNSTGLLDAPSHWIILLLLAFSLCPILSMATGVDTCAGETSVGNPYTCCDNAGKEGGNTGNCTWFVWKMAKDRWNIKDSDLNCKDAFTWLECARQQEFEIKHEPQSDVIAVDTKGGICVKYEKKKGEKKCIQMSGHVAWVECADYKTHEVIVSEQICGGFKNGLGTRLHHRYPMAKFEGYILKKWDSSSSGSATSSKEVPATHSGNPAVGDIVDRSPLGAGCGCAFSQGVQAPSPSQKYLFESMYDGNAMMNIDGKDINLTRITCDLGSKNPDQRLDELWHAQDVDVQVEYLSSKVCEGVECELTEHQVLITVRTPGGNTTTAASGSCGC